MKLGINLYKHVKKTLKTRLIKRFAVAILILSWILAGYPAITIPGLGIFPPKIQETKAAACTIITIATGTDPTAATIAPGSGIADRGLFTLQGNGSNCAAVSAMTVTLAGSGTPYVGLAEVRITDSAGSTLYYSAVTSFSSNSVSFSGGTSIIATTSLVTYKIRVTPLAHIDMPAVPGASYAINPYVSAWTTGETKSGTDSNPNTTTIDNLSPGNVSASTATAATEQVNLGWTNPADADVTTGGTIVVLRNTSAVSDTPVEGTTYTVGNLVGAGNSYVACVVTGSPPATSCSDTGLVSGTAYHYKIFAQDSRGNYSQTGVVPTGSPATPKGTTTLSTSSDPAPATVAPGSGIVSAGQFALTTSTGSDTVTALTLTLAGSPVGSYAAASSVSIRATSCAGTLYFAAVTPSSDSVAFSGGTALPVSTGGDTYYICVTPKDHTLASGTYSVSPYVSATWTSGNGNTKAGTDTNANALTIDNTAPNGATSVSGLGGVAAVTLNWTASNSTDFNTTSGSVIYRWLGASAGAEVPAEGSTATTGAANGTATTACVVSSAISAVLSKIDGTGGSAECTTAALTSGQAYTYKVFQKDNYGNYDTGVLIGTFTPSAAAAYLTQNNFRFYVTANSVTLTDPWSSGTLDLGEKAVLTQLPAQNLALTSGDKIRIKINFGVTVANLTAAAQAFQLEYSAAEDCTTASSWTAVGAKASAGIWRLFDEAALADSTVETNNLSNSTGTAQGYYSEINPSSTNPNAVNISQLSEWDWPVENNGAAENTTYCFRMAKSGGAAFDAYNADSYPKLTTAPGTSVLMRHGNFFQNGSEKGFFWTN